MLFDKVDKTNRAAIIFVRENKDKIDEICKPLLEHLHIEGFVYCNYSSNGYGLTLSNQIDVHVAYCDYLYREGTVLYPNEVRKTPSNRYYFTWTRLAPTKGYNFPVAKGINIYKTTLDAYEGFVFYTQRMDPEVENFFIDNMDLLKRFGEYFKVQAADLIEMNDPKKLVYIKHPKFFQNCKDFYTLEWQDQLHQLDKFIESTIPSQLTLDTHLGPRVILTKQETECMKLLCFGKTAKEIGQELGLSPRTVESYLERIKAKSGLLYKSDLIKAFYKNAIKWQTQSDAV